MPTASVKPLSKKKQAKLDYALYTIACHYESKKQEQLSKALTSKPEPLPVRVNFTVNFTAEVYGFYVMQEWQAWLREYPWSLPSHLRWKEDLDRIQDEQARQFARALRDYMALACFGEARYGRNLAKDNGETIKGSIRSCMTRTGCYEKAPQYDVIALLKGLSKYFGRTGTFDGSTGGPPWKEACEYALTYQQVSDTQFIDTVIDLRHHSDHLFNKPCVFYDGTGGDTSYYDPANNPSAAIQRKAEGALWYVNKEDHTMSLFFSYGVYSLAVRGLVLGILPAAPGSVIQTKHESDFQPIQWGTKRLESAYGEVEEKENEGCLANIGKEKE